MTTIVFNTTIGVNTTKNIVFNTTIGVNTTTTVVFPPTSREMGPIYGLLLQLRQL